MIQVNSFAIRLLGDLPLQMPLPRSAMRQRSSASLSKMRTARWMVTKAFVTDQLDPRATPN